MSDDVLDIKEQIAALLESCLALGQIGDMLALADLIENLIEAKIRGARP